MTPTTRLPLVERLRRTRPDHKRVNGKTVSAYFPVNPEGEEAAALIEKQGALVASLVEALTKITEIGGVNGETEEYRQYQSVRLNEQGKDIARAALLAAKNLGERG